MDSHHMPAQKDIDLNALLTDEQLYIDMLAEITSETLTAKEKIVDKLMTQGSDQTFDSRKARNDLNCMFQLFKKLAETYFIWDKIRPELIKYANHIQHVHDQIDLIKKVSMKEFDSGSSESKTSLSVVTDINSDDYMRSEAELRPKLDFFEKKGCNVKIPTEYLRKMYVILELSFDEYVSASRDARNGYVSQLDEIVVGGFDKLTGKRCSQHFTHIKLLKDLDLSSVNFQIDFMHFSEIYISNGNVADLFLFFSINKRYFKHNLTLDFKQKIHRCRLIKHFYNVIISAHIDYRCSNNNSASFTIFCSSD
jgi:hypothetical protein